MGLEHRNTMIVSKLSGPATETYRFSGDFEKLIKERMLGRLPKLVVEPSLYHSHIAQMFTDFGIAKGIDRTQATGYCSTAKKCFRQRQKTMWGRCRNSDEIRVSMLNHGSHIPTCI